MRDKTHPRVREPSVRRWDSIEEFGDPHRGSRTWSREWHIYEPGSHRPGTDVALHLRAQQHVQRQRAVHVHVHASSSRRRRQACCHGPVHTQDTIPSPPERARSQTHEHVTATRQTRTRHAASAHTPPIGNPVWEEFRRTKRPSPRTITCAWAAVRAPTQR